MALLLWLALPATAFAHAALVSADPADNAVLQASTPNFDRLWRSCPHAFLRTSGLDVGLPQGQMGNSEVGHLNIGAGRVVMQDLPRIGNAIEDGSIARAPALTGLIDALKQSGGACHLLGLVSLGGCRRKVRVPGVPDRVKLGRSSDSPWRSSLRSTTLGSSPSAGISADRLQLRSGTRIT